MKIWRTETKRNSTYDNNELLGRIVEVLRNTLGKIKQQTKQELGAESKYLLQMLGITPILSRNVDSYR